MANKDPVRVIRKALSRALVFYYPFAGKLREGRGGKLMVDCSGEGVMFVEADADVTLEQFGDNLQPPFIYSKAFLCDVPDTEDIKKLPLLLVQVTRLKCGGFVVSTGWNHVMADGAGLSQFMHAWAEMARGMKTPSISPLWRLHATTVNTTKSKTPSLLPTTAWFIDHSSSDLLRWPPFVACFPITSDSAQHSISSQHAYGVVAQKHYRQTRVRMFA